MDIETFESLEWTFVWYVHDVYDITIIIYDFFQDKHDFFEDKHERTCIIWSRKLKITNFWNMT